MLEQNSTYKREGYEVTYLGAENLTKEDIEQINIRGKEMDYGVIENAKSLYKYKFETKFGTLGIVANKYENEDVILEKLVGIIKKKDDTGGNLKRLDRFR
jgi:hypothetical protein